MSKLKGITMVWLSKTDLSNLNAGEGGGGNVTELKTYDNGRKPYASGQSVRHAIRQAVERLNPGMFLCTPEFPCGEVDKCWLCDIFGYLNPRLGEGSDRRWSPLKMTPALGQIGSEIITDLLIRMSDVQRAKANEDSEADSEETDVEIPEKKAQRRKTEQRIAYVQMMSNIYRVGLSLDVANLGKVIRPQIKEVEVKTGKKSRDETSDKQSKPKKEKRFAGWETVIDIGSESRRNRALAVLEAIGGLADFAKQARNAASLAPDVFIAATHSRYTHRTLRVLALNDAGNLNKDEMRVVLQDLHDDGAQLFFGFTPNVVKNEDELLAVTGEFNLEPINPARTLRNLMKAVQETEIE